MSGERERKPRRGGDFLRWGAKLVAVFAAWALSIFTVQGFLAALYLAPSEADLWWPTGTRIVWWVLFYVGGSAWVQRLMWREAKHPIQNHLLLWGASHVSAAKRLARRVVWMAGGVAAGWRQFRAHGLGIALPQAGTLVPALPDVSRPVSEPQDAPIPAAA